MKSDDDRVSRVTPVPEEQDSRGWCAEFEEQE